MPHPNCIILPHNRKLAYEEYGDNEGYPIFFFHGWPSSRLQARRFHKNHPNIPVPNLTPGVRQTARGS